MAKTFAAVAMLITAAAANAQTVGTYNLTGINVDGPVVQTRTVTLPAGTVGALVIDLSVMHFGTSFGRETRLQITTPSGTSYVYSGADFGFGGTRGYHSGSITRAITPTSSAGIWTISLWDSFNDPSNPDYTVTAGRVSFETPINVAPTITIDDDVATGPVASETFAFTAADVNVSDTLTSGYAFTAGACDNSLTFTTGTSVTVSNDTSNGQYLCATTTDGTETVYRRSANVLNIDASAPSVAISGMPTTISGTDPFQVTVSFSEDVSGFEGSDILVSGASVGAVTGGPATYTVTVTPAGNADVTLSVPAGAAQDAAGNDNTGSGDVTATSVLAEQSSELIADYIQARMRNLIALQPGLLGIVRGGGHFDAQVTRSAGQLDLATDMSKPLWFQLRGSWSEAGTQSDSYVLGVVGTHFQPNDDLWLGAMVQFDDASTRDGLSRTSGQGWLAGPYFVAKLPEQAIYVEGSLLYGQTRNRTSPLGTYTDSFDTERMLATLRVTGEIVTDAATWMPSLSLIHGQDRQAAYTDGLGNPIAAQVIGQTDLSMGLSFAAPVAVAQGQMTLTGGASAHWAKSSGVVSSPYDGGSGRLDLGLSYLPGENTSIRLESYVDGIGNDGFKAYGASLDLRIQF